MNGRGLVLALERSDIPGAWQLPQGGLDEGEEPGDAVLREIEEETGIGPDRLSLIGRHPEPLAYELPPGARRRKTGRGQVQYWFLFRYGGEDADVRLPADGEFRAWRWLPFARIRAEVVEFRRAVYRRLEEHFAEHLAGGG